MFRRKDETNESGNSNIPSVTSPVSGTAGHASAAARADNASSATAAHSDTAQTTSHSSAQPTGGSTSSASASTNAPYVPTARPSAPTVSPSSEPSRNASAQAPSYRPTPIAEFNRGATRAAPDTMRNSGSVGAAPPANNAEKATAAKTSRRVLTVGNDILLKGEIATCDRLVIEGRVEAKLSEVHTVEIAESGSFKGTAEVEDAEISGVFEGDLVVRNRLVIYATGEVRGNIGYGEIEIERGGKLTGQIKTVANAQGAKGKSADVSSSADKRPAAKESAAA